MAMPRRDPFDVAAEVERSVRALLGPLEALVPEELRQDYRTTLITVCNDVGYRWDACRVTQMDHKYRKLKTKYHELKETRKTIANSPKAKR